MVYIDTDTKYIHINRGDIGTLHFSCKEEDGTDHTFEIGDIIRFTVKEKYSEPTFVLRKDVEVTDENTTVVDIELSQSDTTIGDLIDKPKKYVYDVALNEDITIIGYDEEEGPKYFILYPEASNDE